MMRKTDVSFPGIGVAETITVSPGPTVTSRWSPFAIRLNTAIGSPWLPVTMKTTLLSGSLAASLESMSTRFGSLR